MMDLNVNDDEKAIGIVVAYERDIMIPSSRISLFCLQEIAKGNPRDIPFVNLVQGIMEKLFKENLRNFPSSNPRDEF